MNNKQIEEEWKKLNFELFENKPKMDVPYPQDVVERREFLLFAQVHLGNIMDAKSKKNKWDEKFETEAYHNVMRIYYRWNQDDRMTYSKNKPKFETTTLWDFPTQNYGDKPHGDNKYSGVTPAFVIWNLIQRYTKEGDLVVDPMCGSGTTIDVCKEENRNVIGFDIVPYRDDIKQANARELPLENEKADFIFIDSPYSDNIKYNDHPDNIGNISCEDPRFFEELEKVAKEMHRILKPGKYIAWIIGDQAKKKKFVPAGFKIYSILEKYFKPVDIICLTRHNQTSNTPIWHDRARRYNFYLRGFKYLIIMQKGTK